MNGGMEYTVHAPTYTYDQEWVVKMPGGFVAFTGEERQARRYSRIMNRRLASEELGVEYRRFASTARSSWG